MAKEGGSRAELSSLPVLRRQSDKPGKQGSWSSQVQNKKGIRRGRIPAICRGIKLSTRWHMHVKKQPRASGQLWMGDGERHHKGLERIVPIPNNLSEKNS